MKMSIIIKVFREGHRQIAELCKGSTADSDSVCEGSNPSPAAKLNDGARFEIFKMRTVFFVVKVPAFRGFDHFSCEPGMYG